MSERVEIYTKNSVLVKDDTVTIRVGGSVATLSVGEWSRMLSRPSRVLPSRDNVY